jgi:undecaprenyl-diphosphatase
VIISILLGILQGIAEWLPISSEGWLYIISVLLLRINPQEALSSALFLHLGTSIAAIFVLREDIKGILKKSGHGKEGDLGFFILSATIITCLAGIPLYLYLREFLLPSSGKTLALAMGFILLLVGLALKLVSSSQTKRRSFSSKYGTVVGLIQALSVLPGVSRSGITLAALISLGYGKESLKLSFILGIPVTLGASLFQLRSVNISMFPAFVSSFLFSIFFLRALLSLSYRTEPWKFSIFFGLVAIAFSLPFFML